MAGTLYVEIVSPAGGVFKGDVVGIKAPGVQGSFEVLHNHAPMLAAFEVGSLELHHQDDERITYATSGGFLEVINNHVTVLAETAEPSSEIDIERAKAAEERALQRLQDASPEERAKAQADLERARNRVRVSMGQVGRRN